MAQGLLRPLMVAVVIAGMSAPAMACDDDGGEYTSWVSLLPTTPTVVATTVPEPITEDG